MLLFGTQCRKPSEREQTFAKATLCCSIKLVNNIDSRLIIKVREEDDPLATHIMKNLINCFLSQCNNYAALKLAQIFINNLHASRQTDKSNQAMQNHNLVVESSNNNKNQPNLVKT